jgi:hypothetical protein
MAQTGDVSSLGYLRLTLSELERCIAWIPLDKRVLIHCSDGYTPQVMNRLKSLHTTRHLYLLRAAKRSAQSIGLVRV